MRQGWVVLAGNSGVLDGVTLCRSQVPAQCCFEKSDLASTMPRSTLEGVHHGPWEWELDPTKRMDLWTDFALSADLCG